MTRREEEFSEIDSPARYYHQTLCSLHAPGEIGWISPLSKHSLNNGSVRTGSGCGLFANKRARKMTEDESRSSSPNSFSRARKLMELRLISSLTLLVISSFLISISTSSEVLFQPQFRESSTNAYPLNNVASNNNNNNNGLGSVSGRNINSGIFSSNNFGSSSSGSSSSLPNSSGLGTISSSPIPAADGTSSNSRPTAYFIAGLANQIRKINATAIMLLTRDKPFQLQFRTVCPFGNIVNDDKFRISINSGGNMTFTTKPSEFPSAVSHHSVADGRWHSITFTGDLISLDDHEFDAGYSDATTTPVVHWDSNYSAEADSSRRLKHMLHFFDGFVGCIRGFPAPTHEHAASGGRRQQNIQSNEESYFTPESPSEHQIVSLHDLFQLRTPFAPCNDTDVELSSVHSCFNPETFVLCSKCQNGATCRPEPMSDSPMNNQCECPPNTEDVEYSGRYCEHPPPTMFTHPDGHVYPSSAPDSLQGLTDIDPSGQPISAPSNVDSTYVNSTNLDLISAGRLDAPSANMEFFPTTTTTEPPQEFPFELTGSDCPCHRGECVPSTVHLGQYYCNCTSTGYEGNYCDEDVDECSKFPGICNNGICQNSPGKYECFCRPGWTGKDCSRNYDECLSNPCKNNATCHDLVDAYSCECQPGFTGFDCEEEINECESNPCQNDGTCEDRLNDYVCSCVPGFEGKSCDINIDECLSTPCQHGGRCIDKINGFECDCVDTGFDGDVCQNNVDDCTPDSCQHNGTCIDVVKDFRCECHRGYDGRSCEIDLDECSEGPCLHGQCFQKSNKSLYSFDTEPEIRDLLPPHFSYDTAEGYVCLCLEGYKGANCEIDIDECALQLHPCSRNGNCKDQVNGYRCECHPGYFGEKCELEINECDSNPCQRGECIDRIGDYECRCPEGYGAKNCGVLLTGCVRDPCDKVGFAKCSAFYDETTNNHTFTCECKEGYTGRTCSLNTVMSFSGTGPLEITRNDKHYDNGNYELNFKFRTTLPDVLLIIGSGITYFYLTLSSGKLNLQSSLLNSLEGISVGQNLSNAELHKVWISVNSTHIALAADSQQTFYPIQTEDVHTGFNVTYIGGGIASTNAFVNNPTKKAIKSQFIGCMQDIIINGDSEVAIPERSNSTNIEPYCRRTDQCKPNPCQNAGLCTDLWQNFTCKCSRPYLGKECHLEYMAATFLHESVNNSLVRVDIAPEIRNKFVTSSFEISMFVRTRQRNGTIFFMGSDTVYLEAFLGGNSALGAETGLVVHARWSDPGEDTNSKVEVYAVDGLQITDGYPHLISIMREKTLVKISLNGTEHFRKSVGNKITFAPPVLYLGGKPAVTNATSNHVESVRVTRSIVEENTEVTEDATTSPDPSAVPLLLEGRTAKETVHEEAEELVNEIPVENPFKGVIQDVRVNFSANEALPVILGHSHLQHARVQNHFVVEFYPLDVNSSYSMGEPLGTIHKQNLLEGVQSDDACKINPCKNGGTCETTWNDFKCNCEEGIFDGRLCEFKLPCAIMNCPQGSVCHNIGWKGFECVSEVAFQGTGDVSPHYHLVSTELENITFSSIGFRFRTKAPGNVLYIANGSTSFRVAIEEEMDSLNQSVDAVAIYIDSLKHSSKVRNALDGRWHNVSIRLSISEKDALHLIVDSKEYKLTPSVEIGSISLDFLNELIKAPTTEIVVGSHVEHRDVYNVDHEDVHGNHVGHPEDAHNQFYRGCLDDIQLGEYRLPFVSPTQLKNLNNNLTLATTTAPTAFYIVESSVQGHNLHLGCIVCYEDECENGGRCTHPEESFDCNCRIGFEGTRCQINIDECQFNDCRNDGICVDGIANYTCHCPPGYEGWKCDENINECITEDGSEPCKNGGTCIDGIASYNCVCTDEFLGQYCEKRKRSTCRDEPCENGATCRNRYPPELDKPNFICECAPGWEGETCSIKIDWCKDIRCANGGTCYNKPLGSECICMPGYTGPLCETDINECLSQPCKNNGSCSDKVNGFQCHCDHTGYTGPFCDDDIDECIMGLHDCPHAQMCENLPGKYTCVCPDAFMCGDHCNVLNPCTNLTCHNGGTCIPHCFDEYNPTARCECTDHYQGEFCQLLTMAPPSQQLDILLIIIPVIAALLIAATIGVVILVRMARQKRATRGVYSPSQQEYCNPRVELDNVMKPPPEERLI